MDREGLTEKAARAIQFTQGSMLVSPTPQQPTRAQLRLAAAVVPVIAKAVLDEVEEGIRRTPDVDYSPVFRRAINCIAAIRQEVER